MKSLEKQTIYFLSEQDGKVEREFKEALYPVLSGYRKFVRAYLARVKYSIDDDTFNVALCFKVEMGMDEYILNQSIKLFKSMFGSQEHLDVTFIDEYQENDLRKICCPFFTSDDYQINIPDFFLASTESYRLEHSIACFKKRRLYGEYFDGYLLCDIKPSIIGQYYGVEGSDIQQIVLASRHQGYSLFPINEWPAYVHVAILLIDLKDINYIQKEHLKHIAWADLYRDEKDIKFVK